jgi:hypothetical protein
VFALNIAANLDLIRNIVRVSLIRRGFNDGTTIVVLIFGVVFIFAAAEQDAAASAAARAGDSRRAGSDCTTLTWITGRVSTAAAELHRRGFENGSV